MRFVQNAIISFSPNPAKSLCLLFFRRYGNKYLIMVEKKCDFKVKTINSDFLVTEVPLLPTFDPLAKEYTYVWLKKSNYTTFEAIEKIKDHFGLNFFDIAAEGLKDEDGITEQIISIKKKLSKKAVKDFNTTHTDNDTFIVIDRVMGFGSEPVAAKSLFGNTFQIVVRNLTDNEANRIVDFTKKHKFFPFVNYYDNQRFGLPGGPYITHFIGKAICESEWDEAFELLKKTGNKIPEGKTGKDAFEALNPGQVGFFVSAFNSYLWNKAVSKHIKQNFKSKKYDFPNLDELYLPIITESTPSNSFMIDGYRFNKETFITEEAKIYRDMILPTVVFAKDIKDDEIFIGKKRILLTFFIFTGCYATMVAKQIIKTALEEKND